MKRCDTVFVKKLLSCLLAETLFELSNTAAGIEDTLLAGVERVAYRTNFNVDRASGLGAASLENFATSASNGGLYVLWVNLGLHYLSCCQAGSRLFP